METNRYINIIVLISIAIFFNACGARVDGYVDTNAQMYKKRFELLEKKFKVMKMGSKTYDKYKLKNKDLKFKGYNVKYKVPYPIFKDNGYNGYGISGTRDTFKKRYLSWTSIMHKYIFHYEILNKKSVEAAEHKEYLLIDSIYNKSNKIIDNYINFKCIISKKHLPNLKKYNIIRDCYAKKLEKDVYLFAKFGYVNTKKDKELFQNEIIPTMLKSIKLTPTTISPWKLYL